MMTTKSNRMTLLSAALALCLILPMSVHGGNEDRAGSAGGSQLLVNPWARNTGMAAANGASVIGVESSYLNISGLALTQGTEFNFSHTRWMSGSGVGINTLGIATKVGDTAKMNALGLNVMSMNFGDIPVTTTGSPNGGLGTYSPNYINVGLSYAKGFTRTIYGGFNMKILSQGVSNMRAMGVALDAGIRYISGERDHMKLGISLKNIGPPMQFTGDGLSFTSQGPNAGNDMTVRHRSDEFELPSLLNIAASYDLKMPEDHGLSVHGTFVSNSFTKDQVRGGLEYAFKDIVKLRGGYIWENGINDPAERTTIFTGPTAGISVKPPVSGIDFTFDYSYRGTNPYAGTHSIGARLLL
jgi:hypothetical protein